MTNNQYQDKTHPEELLTNYNAQSHAQSQPICTVDITTM